MKGPIDMLVTWPKGIKVAQGTEVGSWLALRWNYSGLSRWAHFYHRVLLGEQRKQETSEREVIWEAGVGKM